MKKLLVPTLLGLFGGAALTGWVASCAADGIDGYGSGGGAEATGGSTSSGRSDASIDVAPDGEEPPGPVSYADLCGEGRCIPGAPRQCEGGSGTAGAGGGSGAGGEAGAGGAGGGAAAALGCQVDVGGDEPEPVCGAIDPTAIIGDSCNSASQCNDGQGCVVGGDMAGVCREYCCEDLDCPTDHYCSPRPVAGFLSEKVPVCVKAEPCPPLTADVCQSDDETCTIVGANGLTSCVPAGDGQTCDPCPCADGYMCNLGTGVCQKLCHTASTDECGGMGGACQAILEDVGVCIGGDADCGF